MVPHGTVTRRIGIRGRKSFVFAAPAPDEGAVGDDSLHATATSRHTATTVPGATFKIFNLDTPQFANIPDRRAQSSNTASLPRLASKSRPPNRRSGRTSPFLSFGIGQAEIQDKRRAVRIVSSLPSFLTRTARSRIPGFGCALLESGPTMKGCASDSP